MTPPSRSGPSSSSASPRPEDLKGKLVLVDEDNGDVVGSLCDDSFRIREDPSLIRPGNEKVPVIIDLPEDGGETSGRRDAFVHTLPPMDDSDDFFMKSAHVLR